ncbi:MAG: heparinase II/III family protein, partial [Salibacteraceae bacterium]
MGLFLLGGLACNQPVQDQPVATANGEEGPRLLLTAAGVQAIRAMEGTPVIDRALHQLQTKAESAMQQKPVVPVPKDPGGGFTHEKHKANYQDALATATWYLLDGNEAAKTYCKELLLAYAQLYPTLPLHPQAKKQAPGKLFWQVLNEEVALVHFIQAYDAIAADLTAEEKQQIEEGLLLPMVVFIRDETSKTFNSIHNHGMWAVAGVGMTGLALQKAELVEQALYGTDPSGNCGFFKQIESLFSPDGYYAEGPYYQRYALMPLVLLAQALEKNQPERKVFAFRDGVILKAIETTVQMSTSGGAFFPINDAIKSKTIQTPELGIALPVWFANGGKNQALISLMEANGNLMLTDAVVGLDATPAPFQRQSVVLQDGPKGQQGGIAVVREKNAPTGLEVLFKYGTHGMGHGHFDQLGLLVYDDGRELLSDYGAARFLNVPQKEGGRYLAENKLYAQTTIAHNTLVVDQMPQHGGKVKVADAAHPWQVFEYFSDGIQAVAAADTTAYPGVALQRTVALVQVEQHTFLIDIYQARSAQMHTYDLPFHYHTQRIHLSPEVPQATALLQPLGEAQGYQYLWHLGTGEPGFTAAFTLLDQQRFFTVHTQSDQAFAVTQAAIGANDPLQNLRRENALIYRSEAQNQTWVSVMAAHGHYDAVTERTEQAYSPIANVQFQPDYAAA